MVRLRRWCMGRDGRQRGNDRLSDAASGVIRADEVYTIDEFKRRLRIRDATLRAARRAGLRVKYVHGRAFVFGQDWFAYVANATKCQ